MKQLGVIFAVLLLVGCADLPKFGTSATPETTSTTPETTANTDGDPVADTGYVFDDEGSAPAATNGPNADSNASVDPSKVTKIETKTETKPDTSQTGPRINSEKPDQNAAARLACTRQKGRLTKTPAGFFVCVTDTGQGQKTCTSANQCDGVCLARSGTCSPFKPLIGCNEVITNQGGMQTLCID